VAQGDSKQNSERIKMEVLELKLWIKRLHKELLSKETQKSELLAKLDL